MRCLQRTLVHHGGGLGPQASQHPQRPALPKLDSYSTRVVGHLCAQHGGRMQLSCRSAAPDDAQPDQLRAIVADFTRRAANASAGQSMSAEGTNGGSSSSSSSSLGTRQHGGRHAGFCWLVGAGPGALEHLTLGAAQLIQQAEAVVYDDLGTQAAMETFAAPSAERHYVGKRGLQKSFKQTQIDALLVELCKQGKRVVRLKGGCPSTFSRVSGEMAALAAAGTPFQLVPGVSSALAAPLLAGFPLTDKLLSRSYAVLSGHDAGAVDWMTLQGIDTLVILMGGASLPGIVKGLQSVKRDDLPVAIIRNASSGEQTVWVATLGTVIAATRGDTLSPSIIVAGQVVQLMQQPQHADE